MKILRVFDSLKFVRAIFVAVACVFILNVAHAATTAIQSVIAYGKTEQNGTPTPTNPVPIMTNNGVLKYRSGKNLFDINDLNISSVSSDTVNYKSYAVPNGTYTMSTPDFPTVSSTANIFFLAGDVSSGASSASNGVLQETSRTINVTNGYYTIGYRSGRSNPNNPKNYSWQIEQGSTATAYVPYSGPTGIYVDGMVETIRDAAGHKATTQMLLGINDTYRDEQNITTGAITRRVGVKVLDGSEDWQYANPNRIYLDVTDLGSVVTTDTVKWMCSHFVSAPLADRNNTTGQDGKIYGSAISIHLRSSRFTSLDSAKQWLADQYANGTPVFVVYPLKTETTESVTAQQMTTAPVRQTLGSIMNMPIVTTLTDGTVIGDLIRVATTKYNEESFEDVQGALTGVFNAVDTVVTQTMSQAQQIDQIANEKQTRPDETCPVGKNCLLVEDEQGVPHWYVIANADDAFPTYTNLQYIRLANGAFIITDIYPNQDTEFLVDFQHEQDALKWLFGTRSYPADASNGQNPINKFALQVFSTSNGGVWMQFDNTTNLEYGTTTVASNAASRLARHQCGIKNQRVWCDGNFIAWSSNSGPTNISNFTATNPLVIGGVQTSTGYSSSTFIGKIYGATDLVPCRRDTDSAVGLCRTSTGDFFGNSAGVGTITAGPEM